VHSCIVPWIEDPDLAPLEDARYGLRCTIPTAVMPGFYNATITVGDTYGTAAPFKPYFELPVSSSWPGNYLSTYTPRYPSEDVPWMSGFGVTASVSDPDYQYGNDTAVAYALFTAMPKPLRVTVPPLAMISIIPAVTALSSSHGSLAGGHEITVHGAGFGPIASDIQVSIGGAVPCHVIQLRSAEELVCKTGRWDADLSSRVHFPSGGGVIVRSHSIEGDLPPSLTWPLMQCHLPESLCWALLRIMDHALLCACILTSTLIQPGLHSLCSCVDPHLTSGARHTSINERICCICGPSNVQFFMRKGLLCSMTMLYLAFWACASNASCSSLLRKCFLCKGLRYPRSANMG
jgi:IPT/TIG domain